MHTTPFSEWFNKTFGSSTKALRARFPKVGVATLDRWKYATANPSSLYVEEIAKQGNVTLDFLQELINRSFPNKSPRRQKLKQEKEPIEINLERTVSAEDLEFAEQTVRGLKKPISFRFLYELLAHR